MEIHADRTTVGCDAIFVERFNASAKRADLPDISLAYPAHDQLITGDTAAICIAGNVQPEIYDRVIDFWSERLLTGTGFKHS